MKREVYIYKDTEVVYDIEGEGDVLVFLHGYLESRKIWDRFSNRFAKDYTVLRLDIPGHGESGVFADTHSMDELATVLKRILAHENIEMANIIGHSMGGYLTMAFVANYPQMVTSFSLFHSTCFSDSEEKRKNRNREIEFIRNGKKPLIVNTNIPNAFADDHLLSMADEIERVKKIAADSDDQGVISLLEGMKVRKDYSGILSDNAVMSLLIWGAKDNYIGEEVFKKLVNIASESTQLTLKNSGHMGFLEEADISYHGIVEFLKSVEQKKRRVI